VTEKRALELEAMKVHKLESIGVLAGGIAHDFNNILTGILANISLLKMTGKRDDSDLRKLDAAEKASLRARDLTQQLLTFAKGGTPVKSVIAPAPLVRESATFSLHGAPVRISFSCAEDVRNVTGDAGQLSQVINNIVINAVQAMPAGGRIDVVMERKDASIVVQVKDTGRGIERENLERIFDPFFTTKESGTGLGLVIASNIMRASGGFINVASEPGKGSTFSLTYPMLDAPSGTLHPAESQAFAALPARA